MDHKYSELVGHMDALMLFLKKRGLNTTESTIMFSQAISRIDYYNILDGINTECANIDTAIRFLKIIKRATRNAANAQKQSEKDDFINGTSNGKKPLGFLNMGDREEEDNG